jgi:hypothetical protein
LGVKGAANCHADQVLDARLEREQPIDDELNPDGTSRSE